MIAFISGDAAEVTRDTVVIDHGGMGWEVFYAHTDRIHTGDPVRIYTYLHITENDMKLYGFSSVNEKQLFLRLISVKGLGPKTAMGILAKADYDRIVGAIETDDVKFLKSMPGIGPKAASQIVLDLKGKLVQAQEEKKKNEEELPEAVAEAAQGLKNFGYRQSEIASAVKKMLEKPGLTTQEYLRIGLRALMKNSTGG